MRQLITLQPLEPYFFGGDRSFAYGNTPVQRAGGYFIRSMDTTPQTTLFGLVRYLGIRNPSPLFEVDADTQKRINPESYDLRKPDQQFGRIKGISNVYIQDAMGCYYAHAPFDHSIGNRLYTPWDDYSAPIETPQGERVYPANQYTAKDGIAHGWIRLSDLTYHETLIDPMVQVGVATDRNADGFYKMERKNLKKGLHFAFLADIEDGFDFPEQVVYLGQKKSAFLASWVDADKKLENQPDFSMLTDRMNPQAAYALSDIYIKGDLSDDVIRQLYSCCSFVCAEIKEHRGFFTRSGTAVQHSNRFVKGKELIRLISAGSVFLVRDAIARERFLKSVKDAHAQLAGFNQLVYGKEWS